MISAELADWVEDLIHLPQGHSVHLSIEFIEVCFDLFVVVGVILVVAFVEHGQHGIAISVAGWMLLDMGFQGFKKLFHNITVLLRFG